MANLNSDSIYQVWFGETMAHKLSLDDAIDEIDQEERALDED